MQPKLVKFNKVDFVQAKWSGSNESGYQPLGDKVIVAIDKASSISMGGVEIPQDVVERLSMAAEIGTLVAQGEGAFKYNSDGTLYIGRVPQPGERVFIERYAGQIVTGKDGWAYRVMDCKSIGAIQEGK